jgi:hypothetical protein
MILVVLGVAASIAAAGGWMLGRLQRLRMLSSAMLAASMSSVLAIALSYISGNVLHAYGWTLFVALPVVMGFVAVIIFARRNPVRMLDAISVSLLTLVVTGAGLIFVGIEGLICLAMALPLAGPLAIFGGLLAYAVLQRQRTTSQVSITMLLVVVLVPGASDYERRCHRQVPVFAVTTALDIPASPDVVWRATIAPSHLAAPDDWIFRAGIAYPLAAHIEGSGPGATRYCNFSTGDLVEPVLEWQEPRLLRFAVKSNPEPMVEMTPYRNIHPPHLKGFLVSRQGQFRLLRDANGGTRLEATTWYEHNLWPAEYWRWWSDFIIHRVHKMVLDHVRDTAELRPAS